MAGLNIGVKQLNATANPYFPLHAEHLHLWQRLQHAIDKQSMPQALLLIAPRYIEISSFVAHLVAVLLCQGKTKPCDQCDSCHLFGVNTHPDFETVQAETEGGVIKIEKIRALQAYAYHTPQLGRSRVIVIKPADKMNVSAANALLKILEEPPSHLYFILVAEQSGTLPATILSRCQQMIFPDPLFDSSNYLKLGEYYPAASVRGQLCGKSEAMLVGLSNMMEGQSSVCTLAAEWVGYDLHDLMWLLYLMTAQAIQVRLLNHRPQGSQMEALHRFASALHPVVLFGQLEKIKLTLRQLSKNISMNPLLTLEDIFVGYR